MSRRFTKADALKAVQNAIRNVEARRKAVALFTPFLTRNPQ